MSLEAMKNVLSLAIEDPAFAAQLATDPGLLTGYDLSRPEREALLFADQARLRELGVDEHLLKGLANIGSTRQQGEAVRTKRPDDE